MARKKGSSGRSASSRKRMQSIGSDSAGNMGRNPSRYGEVGGAFPNNTGTRAGYDRYKADIKAGNRSKAQHSAAGGGNLRRRSKAADNAASMTHLAESPWASRAVRKSAAGKRGTR